MADDEIFWKEAAESYLFWSDPKQILAAASEAMEDLRNTPSDLAGEGMRQALGVIPVIFPPILMLLGQLQVVVLAMALFHRLVPGKVMGLIGVASLCSLDFWAWSQYEVYPLSSTRFEEFPADLRLVKLSLTRALICMILARYVVWPMLLAVSSRRHELQQMQILLTLKISGEKKSNTLLVSLVLAIGLCMSKFVGILGLVAVSWATITKFIVAGFVGTLTWIWTFATKSCRGSPSAAPTQTVPTPAALPPKSLITNLRAENARLLAENARLLSAEVTRLAAENRRLLRLSCQPATQPPQAAALSGMARSVKQRTYLPPPSLQPVSALPVPGDSQRINAVSAHACFEPCKQMHSGKVSMNRRITVVISVGSWIQRPTTTPLPVTTCTRLTSCISPTLLTYFAESEALRRALR